jgi:hypothetical protein
MADRHRSGNGKHKGKGARRANDRGPRPQQDAGTAVKRVVSEVRQGAGEAASQVSEGVRSPAGEVRRNLPETVNVAALPDELTRLVRRYPVPALLVSFGLGYLIANAASRR